MKFQKTLLVLSLLLTCFAPPGAIAQGNNDYAPSSSVPQETPASLPPPGLEAASTGSSPVGGQGKGHKGKGHKGKGQGGNPQKRQQMMARLDTNGDGMIDDGEKAAAQAKRAQRKASGAGGGASGDKGKHGSQDPAAKAARKQKMMARFDTNGDGQLDSNEKAALEAFRQQRRQQRMQRQGGGGAPQ
jgi:hypothetical protein